MSYLPILKRIVPFLLTFILGLLIASFFVSIALPNFEGFRRNRMTRQQCWELRIENDRLRRENIRLHNKLGNWDSGENKFNDVPLVLDVPNDDVPPPPPAPKRPPHRHHYDR